MARTFIGELVLRLKDDMSGKAQAAAGKLDTSIDRIQRAARKLNSTSWGGQFESRLQKLGASASDIDKLRVAWDKLNTSISSRNLSKALAGAERGNFKVAAISEFAAIKSAWDTHAALIEKRTHMMSQRMQTALKPILVAMGGYTGAYMAGVGMREGLTASSAWEREKFRGRMANIPASEQNRLLDESEKLGGKYPSVNITDIAELARSARAMMGSTERGLQILPDLVKGMVTLQSAKGTDAAVGELRNLLRGIDNAGKNQGDQIGINDTRSIIAGLIRAAQVEGSDLDVGKLFQFARRGKIAVPGLSTEFLANVSPAFMQDMTPEGFGTALSSAYQAFVIGSNAVASKKNIARQHEIGIRNDKGLVQADLFGTNPYAWVKEVLIPSLKKQGVDTNDETAVAQEVAQLSRNTNATGLLTRMITQQAQVDRLLEQYAHSMGPEAADEARFKDPFVALKGFTEALRNLSAALGEDAMPTIVSGLNSLTNGINTLQQAWRDGDPLAKLGITGAAVGAGIGAWKITAAIWGLMTAGTNLNAAALALQTAAASLAGGNAVDDLLDGGSKKKSPLNLGKWGWLMGLLPKASPWAAMTLTGGDTNNNSYADASAEERQRMRDSARRASDRYNETGGYTDLANRSGSPDDRMLPRAVNPYDAATEAMRRRQAFEADTGPRGNTPGLGDIFKPRVDAVDANAATTSSMPADNDRVTAGYRQNAETRRAAGVSSNPQVKPSVDMGDANAAAAEADAIGRQIQDALGVSARPNVDTSALREALSLANQLKSVLAGIGPAAQAAHSAVSRQMNRNFADQGVTP